MFPLHTPRRRDHVPRETSSTVVRNIVATAEEWAWAAAIFEGFGAVTTLNNGRDLRLALHLTERGCRRALCGDRRGAGSRTVRRAADGKRGSTPSLVPLQPQRPTCGHRSREDVGLVRRPDARAGSPSSDSRHSGALLRTVGVSPGYRFDADNADPVVQPSGARQSGAASRPPTREQDRAWRVPPPASARRSILLAAQRRREPRPGRGSRRRTLR